MLKRESYTRRMERNLEGWRKRFEARRSEAGRGLEISQDTRETLEAAKAACDSAFAKLAQLRAAAGRYVELRSEMEALWKSIDDTPEAPNADEPARTAARSKTA